MAMLDSRSAFCCLEWQKTGRKYESAWRTASHSLVALSGLKYARTKAFKISMACACGNMLRSRSLEAAVHAVRLKRGSGLLKAFRKILVNGLRNSLTGSTSPSVCSGLGVGAARSEG